jgi:hypothetical protein
MGGMTSIMIRKLIQKEYTEKDESCVVFGRKRTHSLDESDGE